MDLLADLFGTTACLLTLATLNRSRILLLTLIP